jgi:trans-2,3-dihydro-3-hydroxyanthranilate isomerase
MSQPAPSVDPFPAAAELLQALGVARSELPVEMYRNGPQHVFVKLGDEDAVASIRPDFSVLTDLGVAANCFAGRGPKWKTRMFYPAAGIVEDFASGSAAGPLAAHLARHGLISFGDRIEILQGVEINRPSVLYARAEGEGNRIDSIEVGGRAYIVAEGRILVSEI